MVVNYYNKKHRLESFCIEPFLSSFEFSENSEQTIYTKIPSTKIKIKLRGRYKHYLFGENKLSIKDYILANKNKKITAFISKDNCGDYWYEMLISDSEIYKMMNEPDTISAAVGIDVGIKDLMICSDGSKQSNPKYADKQKNLKRILNRKLSRRYGYSNEKFKTDYKKAKENGEYLKVSKGYIRARKKLAKLERDIANRRRNYHNMISTDLVMRTDIVCMETLNVVHMMKNRKLSKALSDAGIGTLLSMIKLKCQWYKRVCVQIDQWFPSSQLCSCCGYKNSDVKNLSVREWICPECHTYHDRDINAAINILNQGLKYLAK